jgi:hypothetical protein
MQRCGHLLPLLGQHVREVLEYDSDDDDDVVPPRLPLRRLPNVERVWLPPTCARNQRRRLETLFAHCPHVRALRTNELPDFECVHRLPRLESLECHHTLCVDMTPFAKAQLLTQFVGPLSLPLLRALGAHCPQLARLVVVGSVWVDGDDARDHLTDSTAADWDALVQGCPHVCGNIDLSVTVTHNGHARLVRFLATCAGVRSLSVHQSEVLGRRGDDADADPTRCWASARWRHLTRFAFDNRAGVAVSWGQDAVVALPALTELDVWSHGGVPLSPLLFDASPSLQSVRWCAPPRCDRDYAALARALATCTQLRSISFGTPAHKVTTTTSVVERMADAIRLSGRGADSGIVVTAYVACSAADARDLMTRYPQFRLDTPRQPLRTAPTQPPQLVSWHEMHAMMQQSEDNEARYQAQLTASDSDDGD